MPVALEKVEGPGTCLKFLGWEIDKVAMQVRISDDKLKDLKDTINSVLDKAGKNHFEGSAI